MTEILAHDGSEAQLDAVMAVMAAAFPPEYGEAWTRAQVRSILLMPGSRLLLACHDGQVGGFCLTRHILEEEEILLIAVAPWCRRRHLASALIEQLKMLGRQEGRTSIFLEMRDGNDAAFLYARHGFEIIGRRPAYYKVADGSHIDALTMQCSVSSNPLPA